MQPGGAALTAYAAGQAGCASARLMLTLAVQLSVRQISCSGSKLRPVAAGHAGRRIHVQVKSTLLWPGILLTQAAQVKVEMECSASELRWLWALQGVLGSALVRDM